MAPTLPAGARTPLNQSPHSEAGRPLNERSQALDLRGGDAASKELQKPEKRGLYNKISVQSPNPLISANNENKGNRLDGLTTRQDRALKALLDSPSIVAAARKAEVGESTLRLWLREDENFQAKLRQIREETLSHTTTRLQQEAERALDSVSSLLASKRRIEAGRASLIRTVIDFAYRSNAHSDLAGVVRSLESDRKNRAQDRNDQDHKPDKPETRQ